MIGIRDVASYLPATTLSSAELTEKFGFKPGFLENKVGVETRHVSAPDESTSDMCVKAFERLRARHPDTDFSAVGLLLLCTQNPDFKLPHTSSVVQHRLGLPQSMLAFDISLGCSGFVATLVTAKALMQELGIRRGLVFTCDPYTKVLADDDKNTRALFGDAASVTLLEEGAPLRIEKSTFGNDGSMFETLIIRGSGTARTEGETESPLSMDGRNIFNMLKRQVPASIRECAEINQLTLADFDMFLFHQASAWLLQVLCQDLGLEKNRVPCNIQSVGNTVSTSIPLLLEEVLHSANALPSRIMMSGFGVGLAWASVVVRSDVP
jgi:3-oxoacyl-[acyl-carrier-protein] synthase-3